MDPAAVAAAREKLKAKFVSTQIGGKGSVRRKTKVSHKAAAVDDKRVNGAFKRLGITPIPGIEEVTIFKDNGEQIHFSNPKVQASIGANTYVVSGNAEVKGAGMGGGGGAYGGMPAAAAPANIPGGFNPPPPKGIPVPKTGPVASGEDDDEDNDELPELEVGGNFEGGEAKE